MGLALTNGGFDVGSTGEDFQQVSAHVEVHTPLVALCSHAWRVLQPEESSTCCMMAHPQQSPPWDSDTETQDSRRSIVDVPEFDLTRGDSDEELVRLDSPGSLRNQLLVMSQTFEQQCGEQHSGRLMTWIRATSFDKRSR